jgi:hypothetical protein
MSHPIRSIVAAVRSPPSWSRCMRDSLITRVISELGMSRRAPSLQEAIFLSATHFLSVQGDSASKSAACSML